LGASGEPDPVGVEATQAGREVGRRRPAEELRGEGLRPRRPARTGPRHVRA